MPGGGAFRVLPEPRRNHHDGTGHLLELHGTAAVPRVRAGGPGDQRRVGWDLGRGAAQAAVGGMRPDRDKEPLIRPAAGAVRVVLTLQGDESSLWKLDYDRVAREAGVQAQRRR